MVMRCRPLRGLKLSNAFAILGLAPQALCLRPRRGLIMQIMQLNQFSRMLLAEWRKLRLPVSDETVVVAVSGGADSTALLLAIEELKNFHKLYTSICVAHLDHRLRKSSGKDAKWVGDLAAKLGFRSVIGRAKIAEEARAANE